MTCGTAGKILIDHEGYIFNASDRRKEYKFQTFSQLMEFFDEEDAHGNYSLDQFAEFLSERYAIPLPEISRILNYFKTAGKNDEEYAQWERDMGDDL